MEAAELHQVIAMKRSFAQVVLSACLSTCLGIVSHAQGGRREDSPRKPAAPNSRPIKTTRVGGGKKSSRNQAVNDTSASLTIIVSPADSALLLNNQQIEGPTIKGFQPGPYILIVRHQGYRDGLRAVVLVPGENPSINVTLEPILGTLNVTPSVAAAVIDIQNAGLTSDDGERRHVGAVENLQLAPGDYEMTVSKEGYGSVTRKFRIEAGAVVFLEPQLQIVAPSTPPPVTMPRPTISPDRPMSIETSDDGKFVLVTLTGRSGQTTDSSGFLDVTINAGASSSDAASVIGMLTGFPIRIDFRLLDNIAEGSVVEPPGPANQWGKIQVRLRVRDFKHTSRFRINWTRLDPELTIQQPPNPKGEERAQLSPAELFEPASVRKKVSPVTSGAARTSNLTGSVIVSIHIDEEGNVMSAKAIEGPFLFRQAAENAAKQWKFNPARRNGRAVQDTQQIRFMFQRQ